MFPNSARDFVVELFQATEDGQLSWEYDHEKSSVEISNMPFKVELQYWFNTDDALGMFFLTYTPENSSKPHNFSALQGESDYALAQRLFDSAQASTIQFPTLRLKR